MTVESQPVVERLRAVPLFAGMTESSIAVIAGIVTERSFEAGEPIVRQGKPGDSFLVLVSGRASIEQDGRPIGQLGAGDFLGEIALLDRRPRTATVVAVEPVRALLIPADAFGEIVDRIPSVRHAVLSALTTRIRAHAPADID